MTVQVFDRVVNARAMRAGGYPRGRTFDKYLAARTAEKSSSNDGRPLEGVDIKVVDVEVKSLPTGDAGRLIVRGAQLFARYYKQPDLVSLDSEGWFDTGDLACVDGEGCIRINGRTKDVLIRGGKNMPVPEIENLLLKHPALAGTSIVGCPDDRLGESACAFIAPRPGASLDLDGEHAWMTESKVAKRYWPERPEIVADLPRTPVGEVQKFKLREMLAAGAMRA